MILGKLSVNPSLVAAAFRLPHDGDLKVAATSTKRRGLLKAYDLRGTNILICYTSVIWQYLKSGKKMFELLITVDNF